MLELNKGNIYEAVHAIAYLSKVNLGKISKNYVAEGLDCLYDKARSARPVRIDQEQADKIVMLACKESPIGHSQWRLRLLVD